jgi:nucleoid-associated protein YgaU
MQTASSLAFDELPRGAGGAGATEQISRVLNDSGLDVPASLYDEALALAREGRLAPAAERLRMLLVLDGTDANAALLLGKVQAGRGQWQDALSHLDNASAQGAVLPPGLREEVEINLRQQIQDAEQHRRRVNARDEAEIRSLRGEAKRLRSDNAALELQVEELGRRVRTWSSVTAVVAGASAALLAGAMFFGGPSADTADADIVEDIALGGGVVAEDVVVGDAPADVVSAPPVAAPVAAAPAAQPAPAVIALPTTHVISKGQTLGHVAKKYYGKSSEWKRILKANDSILHGSTKRLQPGMELTIPAM